MRRPPLFLLVLVLGALASCGGAQDRPVLVTTFPEQGAVLPGIIREVRLTYDEPVTILNPAQVVATSAGVPLSLAPFSDPDDPTTIIVRPVAGSFFRAGVTTVTITSGFEVNGKGHYRLEDLYLRFTLSAGLPVYFGVPAPASVIEAEGLTFTPIHTTPTPGARVPTGLACSLVGAAQRIWVQLENGGGTGAALAWFAPGAAAMTAVSLTHDGAGDLVAAWPALRVTRDGRYLYTAFRDTALQRVRLYRIEVATGLEDASVLLSPAASALTAPQGLAISNEGQYVHVSCSTAAGGRLVQVDTETLTEQDIGPDAGTDGLVLPEGAGATDNTTADVLVAPRLATTAELSAIDPFSGVVTDYPSIVAGSPVEIFLTEDRNWVLQGLAFYADDEAFSYRYRGDFSDERITVIDDATGAGNGPATRVLAMAWFPGFTRVVALLDNDAAVILRFLSSGIEQEDLDDTTPTAAIDLSSTAPGATLVAFPPFSVAPSP